MICTAARSYYDVYFECTCVKVICTAHNTLRLCFFIVKSFFPIYTAAALLFSVQLQAMHSIVYYIHFSTHSDHVYLTAICTDIHVHVQ